MKLQLRIVCSAVLAGITCSPTDVVATEDGRIFGASIEVSQVTEAVQTDASRPEVDFSRIGIVTDLIHDDPEFDPQVNPIAEIELPDGASGTFDPDDWLPESEFEAFLEVESDTEDGEQLFPPGEYLFTFRSPDDVCVAEVQFPRLDYLSLDGGVSRPRVLNASGWRDGKLHLPVGGVFLRWERMGRGEFVMGDTEQWTRIRVVDLELESVVYEDFVEPDLFQAVTHPVLRGGDWQGVDLNGVEGIASGRCYEVILEKVQRTIVIDGGELFDQRTSRVVFEFFVDPEMPNPQVQGLKVSTDDVAGLVELSCEPDPDFDYLVLSGLDTLVPTGGPQTYFETAPEPVGNHVFSDAITRQRQFYLVLPLPK